MWKHGGYLTQNPGNWKHGSSAAAPQMPTVASTFERCPLLRLFYRLCRDTGGAFR